MFIQLIIASGIDRVLYVVERFIALKSGLIYLALKWASSVSNIKKGLITT